MGVCIAHALMGIMHVIKNNYFTPVVICSVSSLLKNLIIVDSVVDKLVIHLRLLGGGAAAC